MALLLVHDVHGVADCHAWQVHQLQEWEPDLVCAEFLPRGERFQQLARQLCDGEIAVDTFVEKSSMAEHWCDPSGYRPLLEFLHGSGFDLVPIDESLQQRQDLAAQERTLLERHRDGEPVDALLDEVAVALKLRREMAMVARTLEAVRERQSSTVAVVTGTNHVPRVQSFLASLSHLDHAVEEVQPSSETLQDWIDTYMQIHQDETCLQEDVPPLVVIDTMVAATVR